MEDLLGFFLFSLTSFLIYIIHLLELSLPLIFSWLLKLALCIKAQINCSSLLKFSCLFSLQTLVTA
jgi:hypothetical protein